MSAKHVACVVLLLWLGWADKGLADEVEVTVDTAQVRVQSEVIASVNKGDRLWAIGREGPWVAVVVKTPAGVRRGWVSVTQVRAVVPPGFDEQSPAPPAPTLVDVTVSATQFVFANPQAVYFEITIVNKGPTAIPYDARQLELTVDDQALKSVFAPDSTAAPPYMYQQLFTSDGRLMQSPLQQLNRLESGELGAGNKVTGWMGFQVPFPIDGGRPETKPKSWVLSWRLGDEPVRLDLTEIERNAAEVKVRPASLDPSVQVLEIGARVNGINGGKVVEALESLLSKRQSFIVLRTHKGFLIDPIAAQWIRNLTTRAEFQSVQPFWVNFVVEGQPHGYYGPNALQFGPYGPMRSASTESIATLEILAQRPDAWPMLAKHLASDSAEIRTVVAQGLAGHRGSPEVVEALAKSATDHDVQVRTAAIYSLGGVPSMAMPGVPTRVVPGAAGQPGGLPSPGPVRLEGKPLDVVLGATGDAAAEVRAAAVTVLGMSDDPRATQAVVKALRDADTSVRYSAVRSAGSHPVDAVAPSLIGMFDDKDWGMTMAVCESLGRLKAEVAVPQLRQLQTSEQPPVAAAAVNALREIGTLSELDAALAKLEVGQINPNEFEVLAAAKDRRCVPQLLESLRGGRDFDQVGRAARLLADLGEASAVEPLINILTYADNFSDEIPRALGRLADKRAIEPLKKALKHPTGMSSRRGAILEALMMFEVPEAAEQVIKAIQENRNSYEVVQLVQALGRSGNKRAISIVEPLLDDQNLCQAAAQALADIGTPEAVAAIRKRLSAPDYKFAMNVISSLVNPPMPPGGPGGPAAQEQQARRTAELLRELTKSTNPTTQSAALQQLQMLEERLVAEELGEFERLAKDRQFDAADKALQTVLDRQLELVEKDPAHVARLNVHVNRMLNTYARNQESKRADGHLVRILTALEAMVSKSADEMLKQSVYELRGRRLVTLLEAAVDVDPNDIRNTMTELAARIKARTTADSLAPEMNTALWLTGVLEAKAQWELAGDAYRMLAEAVSVVADGQFAGTKVMLDGSARRVALMGKPIELTGTCIDGTSFDWAAYRGKVVLVEFWATGLPEQRSELPNARKHYERYRGRGFDVVGVSLDPDRTVVEKLLATEQLPFVTLHDADRTLPGSLASKFGITTIPTAFLVDKEGKVLSIRAYGQELDRLLQEQLGPPYQPKGQLVRVDLGAKATRRRSEMYTGFPNNNLSDLPGGEQTLGGVKFTIGESIVQLSGQRLTDAPDRVEGIVVGSFVARLYMLQGAQFAGETPRGVSGATIGDYRVHYEDGGTESIPMVVGDDVRDWWNGDAGSATSRGIVVWTGANDASKAAKLQTRLYLGAWDNPHPDQRVTTIDFVSANTATGPFCVAITAEEPASDP